MLACCQYPLFLAEEFSNNGVKKHVNTERIAALNSPGGASRQAVTALSGDACSASAARRRQPKRPETAKNMGCLISAAPLS
jgi:hypothetical protein